MMIDEASTESTRRRQMWRRIAGLGLALGLLTAACGTESSTDVSGAPVAELSDRADAALAPAADEPAAASEPAPAPTAVPPAAAAPETTAVVQPATAEATGAQETAEEETAPLDTSPEQAEQPVATPVPAQDTTTAPTAEPDTTMQSDSRAGTWPDWYRPPGAVEVLSVRDNSSGERRITTDLIGLDFETVCEDWRAQAAAVGLSPTNSKQCNDPITRWTVVESAAGADAEIQEVSGVSYDVLFVFDSASLNLGGGAAPAAQTLETTTESAAAPTPAPAEQTESTGVLPAWFNPSVTGTELAHAVENGTYEIAATGTIAASQTYTQLCEEFVTQATAAGWIRQSGDQCGEDSFDGATFVDPATGFEVRVRNYRGAEIVYAFDVAANLTPAQITEIAFDPEFNLLPAGFTLANGEQVIGLAESIDSTGAYNTAIQVSGAAGFENRCELLLSQAAGAQIVLGSCTSDLDLITINTGVNTTVILEDDVYTFVTR